MTGCAFGRKPRAMKDLNAGHSSSTGWQAACPSSCRVNTKRAAAITLEAPATSLLPWALLLAEMGAAFFLFSSGLVPAFLVRSLQVFLRF